MKFFGMSYIDLFIIVSGILSLLFSIRGFIWVTKKLNEEAAEEARRKEHEASETP